jgi:hypothetical protein
MSREAHEKEKEKKGNKNENGSHPERKIRLR